MKTIHPAIAEHVMEENERLRGLLFGILSTPRGSSGRIIIEPDEEAGIRATLSQQAEPVDCPVCCSHEPYTGTCGSGDPRALCNRAGSEPAPAQGQPFFIEPCGAMLQAADDAFREEYGFPSAPAQNEREDHVPDNVFQEEFQTWWEDHGQFCRSGGGDYERTFAFQAWRHLYPMLLQARATRPAQTEQQPILMPERREPSGENPYLSDADNEWNAALDEVVLLNAAPIAQTSSVNWKAVADQQKAVIEQLQAKLTAQTAPQPEQSGLYTCIGKGGAYELIGRATTAGVLKVTGRFADEVIVYRDTESNALYCREPGDFRLRMARAAQRGEE